MLFMVMQQNIKVSEDCNAIKIVFFFRLPLAEKNSPDKNDNFFFVPRTIIIKKFRKHVGDTPFLHCIKIWT